MAGPTLIAAVVGFGAYTAVGASRTRPETERESERTELALLTDEAPVVREPAVVGVFERTVRELSAGQWRRQRIPESLSTLATVVSG